MTSTRCIPDALDSYQKAKITFLQFLFDFSLKKNCSVDQLIEVNIIEQILPLLNDSPNVRSLALTTTGRLCYNCEGIARQILCKKLLCTLEDKYECQSKEFRRNVLKIVKNISKYPELTPELLKQARDLLINGIKDIDLVQREFVLSAMANIANYNISAAQSVMNLNILPHLILCLQCPDIKIEATQLVKVICKQSDDLTDILVNADVVNFMSNNLNNCNVKLIKQTLQCLTEIARFTDDNARIIIKTEPILCKTILYQSHCDVQLRKSAILLLKELCCHCCEVSAVVVQHGALPGLICAVSDDNNTILRLPAVMTLGYIGQIIPLALAIIHSKGLHTLISVFNTESQEPLLVAIIWAINMITGHSAHHLSFLKDTNIFGRLLRLFLSDSSQTELKNSCLCSLQRMVDKCLSVQDIHFLLYESPPEILLPAIKQLTVILRSDAKARRVFVSTGGLKRIQELKPLPGSELCEAIVNLNAQFPDDIVRYYSQCIDGELLAKIDERNSICTEKYLSDNISCEEEDLGNSTLYAWSDPGTYPGPTCTPPAVDFDQICE